jgi:hypothetical protein
MRMNQAVIRIQKNIYNTVKKSTLNLVASEFDMRHESL